MEQAVSQKRGMTVEKLIRMLADCRPGAICTLDVMLPGDTERMSCEINGVILGDEDRYRFNMIVVHAKDRLGDDEYAHLREGALDQLFDRTDDDVESEMSWATKNDCHSEIYVGQYMPLAFNPRPDGDPDVDNYEPPEQPAEWRIMREDCAMVHRDGRAVKYSTSVFDPGEDTGRSYQEYVYTFSLGTSMRDVGIAKRLLAGTGVSLEGYSCTHSFDCCGRWYPNAINFAEENGRLVARQHWYQNV